MNLFRKNTLLIFVSLWWSVACVAQPQSTNTNLVLTSLAPLYQLASSLTENTTITVQNIPERPRSMGSQPTYFLRQSEKLAEQFNQADAALGISRVWSQDPLYLFAREGNIRIVNVDAALPWSHERSGVALTASPSSGNTSPYFWNGPSNAIRMAEIVTFDLKALFPEETDQLETNLQNLRSELLTLKADIENSLLQIDDPFIYALTDELMSLTNEFGIFVDGYFVKQDIDWTEEDLLQLTERLNSQNIPVVIHKWEPSDDIIQAIEAGGSTLVVLNNLELTGQPLTAGIRSNAEALIKGLNAF